MKSGIRLLCLLLCMVMFVSCGKQPKENTEPDKEAAESTSSEDQQDIGIQKSDASSDSENYSLDAASIPACALWVFSESNRMFTGRLVSFDEEISWFYQSENYYTKEGKMNLTIEVDGVYKGDYLVGTTVEEIYTYSANFNDVDNPDFWEVGARYLFAFGEFTEGDEKKPVPKKSNHSAIKLHDSGKYELIDGSVDYCVGSRRNPDNTVEMNNTYELFNDIYNLEPTIEAHFDHLYLYYEDHSLNNGYVWNPGENFEYTFEGFYELAEDVYFGELISRTAYFDYTELRDGTNPDLYIIKVKVMTVYKGDLKPGDIIEDISFKYWGSHTISEYDSHHSHKIVDSNKHFFFTGGALDLGYSLDSENSAS